MKGLRMRNLLKLGGALLLVGLLASPLRAGTVGERPKELLDALRQRVQEIKGYAVTIHYTKRSGTSLKSNVIRYESWGASQNIRIRYLEGDRAGVEALYTAAQHKVEVRLPHLPVTLSFDPEELDGDRRIYETDLGTIIAQLQNPAWEITGLKPEDSLGNEPGESVARPLWALTMVNRYLGQWVVLIVDARQWLPRRIERIKSNGEDYEVWKFEDYRLDPPADGRTLMDLLFSNNG